ncbi:hypothetical protein [Aquidulcibacter sp.]|jgi:hypothetical protein|uniref:hypothetical protein n=1 Tax=Aquidulcibacter sp. TaxID=2052990 RepID=UPI0028AE76E4|nr:hypothetical protein [Aquidulcibacter sp.]
MEIVNGYMCRDCTDVSYAKKNIDPAHPKDGPQPSEQPSKANPDAVKWGGALAELRALRLDSAQADTRPNSPRLNLLA